MARKTTTVEARHGRDKGKKFLIREMSAFDCEEWGRRAVSAVYRCATSSDNYILSLLSKSMMEVFSDPELPELSLPSDGSLTADDPVMKTAREEAKAEAVEDARKRREEAPTQMAAVLGIRLFFQLPPDEQTEALRPLLRCVEVIDPFKEGHTFPMTEDVGGSPVVTKAAREFVEEPQTVALLEAEAFKLHTGFFTDAARRMSGQYLEAMQRAGRASAT